MKPDPVVLALLGAFPFSFLVDADGRVCRLGQFFEAQHPDLLDMHFSDAFDAPARTEDDGDLWLQIRSRTDPATPSERLELVFTPPAPKAAATTSKTNEPLLPLCLAGTTVPIGPTFSFLFLGTVTPGEVRRLSAHGLSISDFGPIDPTPEFAMMAEVNAGMLADSQLMNQQIKAAHDQTIEAKKELEYKNRFLGTIMELLPISLSIRDAKTRQFVLVNRALGTDMAAADYLGRTLFDLLPEAKARELTALDDQVVDAPSRTMSGEFVIDKADGRHRLHQRLCAVPGTDGRPEFILALTEDITERGKILDELRASEASLKCSQSMASIGSWRYHLRSGQIEWSDQMYTLWGYEPAAIEPTRATIFAQIVADDRMAVTAGILHALRACKPTELMFRLNPKDGKQVRILLDVECELDDDGKLSGLFGTCQDITDRIEAEEKIRRLACQDALTGLPNRFLFTNRLEIALAKARRDDTCLAIHCLDLNDFKGVNDTLGHAIGDELLRQVATRLSEALRASDMVARLGGDEFAIVQAPIETVAEATVLAERLIDALSAPYLIDNHNVFTSASVGIAVSPQNGHDPDKLLSFADTALYQAKDLGRARYQFFSSEMERRLSYRKGIERDLRDAVDAGQFSLHYQPQYCLQSGQLLGAEALLRWNHPKLGWIPPDKFIPIAEEIGQVLVIGRYVLREACREARRWIDYGAPNLRVAVNLSPAQFVYQDLQETVSSALADANLSGHQLELEITETMLMRDREATISTLEDLGNLGVSLALDDFGTGYSSLSYLRRFRIDKIKIDRSFIADVPTDVDAETLVRTILTLGHSLGLKVVAEGIETKAQYDFLVQQGCDEAQGFLLSKPMPGDAFFELVKAEAAKQQPVQKPLMARQ
ncbi:MAG: putative bifunctional diguanylate cyclase/phosphodiesterase [Geminicoccaceae bacterium]